MKSHSASIEKLIVTAHEHMESNHPNSDVITVSCGQLEKALEELTASFRARRLRLKQEYDAFQVSTFFKGALLGGQLLSFRKKDNTLLLGTKGFFPH